MEFEILKKDNRKKWIISVIAVLAVSSVVFFVSTRANYKDEQRLNLINTKVTWNPTDLEIMAIKVQNSSGEYEQANTVPTSGYTLSDKSYCEVNGSKDTSTPMEYKGGKVSIGISKKGTKCYLFFDKLTAAKVLIAKNEMVHETFINDNGELVDTGYRYEGKSPNNYVRFNNELWRIIGVFDTETISGETESLVKLIRSESIGSLAWNATSVASSWNNASLQKLLNNGDYYNRSGDYSEIGLTEEAKKMIKSVLWHIGTWNSSTQSVQTVYDFERSDNENKTESFSGKVGLMYVSDYGFASPASDCPRTTRPDNYSLTNCYGNNWLYISGNQWPISPISSDGVTVISSNGAIMYPGLTIHYAPNKHIVRPSVYLKSNVSIVDNGKDGSLANPYDLALD